MTRAQAAIIVAYAALLAGCNQTTLVPPGQAVRLAEPVQARIATYSGQRDANGQLIWIVAPNRVTLPAGWYAVPPPTTLPSAN